MSRVAIDADGVLLDFFTPLANHFGRHVESVTQWDVFKAWGGAVEQEQIDRVCSVRGWCESLQPYPGARYFLDNLRMRFSEVIIVTSPYSCVPTWTHERTRSLAKHFDIPAKDVIFAKRKELIRADALVDDALHNLTAFPGLRVLFDQRWNATEIAEFPILRRAGYKATYDLLDAWLD